MIYIINWCDFPLCILPWLLSGLLGLFAGWLIWAKWKAKFADMEGKYNAQVKTNAGLTDDLKLCKHHRALLDGDIATANGRVKEMEVRMKNAEANLSDMTKNLAAGAGGAIAGSALTSDSSKSSSKSSSKTGKSIPKSAPKSSPNTDKGEVKATDKSPSDTSKSTSKAGKSDSKASSITDKGEAKAADKSSSAAKVSSKSKAATKTDLPGSKSEKLASKNIKGGYSKFKKNDLKIVEGVGPKIAELLNGAGINTWEEFADSTVEKIQEILDGAGNKFRLANPGSWPSQARLAADEDWKALKNLQDKLDGGV